MNDTDWFSFGWGFFAGWASGLALAVLVWLAAVVARTKTKGAADGDLAKYQKPGEELRISRHGGGESRGSNVE